MGVNNKTYIITDNNAIKTRTYLRLENVDVTEAIHISSIPCH
jgi:hypothetical protein